MKHAIRWLLPAMLFLVAIPAALAAGHERKGASTGATTSNLPQLVKQKQAFLNRLLGDSLAAARIDASGNAQAQQFMSGARERYMKGVGVLQSGETGAANELFNEAIWMIGMARRLVPDSSDRLNENRARYSQMLASIESLRKSFRLHLSHLGRSESDDPGWRRVSNLIDEAKAHAGAERLVEANRTLLQAEYGLLAAFNSVLSARTIDYTPHFSDAKDEFQYEFDRNRSYGDLVPLAIAELTPSGDAIKLIARHVESNRALRDRAQQLAANRNFQAALNSIREATEALQRALFAAGLVVPQEAKDQ